MRQLPLYGSHPTVMALALAAETILGNSPFSALAKVMALSPAASVLYGVNRQTDIQREILAATDVGVVNSRRKYLELRGDGVTTTFTSTQYPELLNAHDDAGILTNAAKLRTVVVANGVILTRVSSIAIPGAGQFRVTQALGVYSIEAKNASNVAFGVGTKIEVFMAEASEIVAAPALVAGLMAERTAFDFMVSDIGATALFAELA